MTSGCLPSLLIVAIHAQAQDHGEVQLPPVTVKVPERHVPRDTSAQATVIDIAGRQGEWFSMPDVVRAAPGVTTTDWGGGQMVTMSIRGSNSAQVLVTLDGLPLDSVAGGGVDLSIIPTSLLDHAEVIRGAVGARYGSGALGGVLELSLRNYSSSSPVTVEAGAGSFGTELATAATNVALGNGDLLTLVHVDRSDGNFPFPYYPEPQLPSGPLEWRQRVNNDSRSASALARYDTTLARGDLDILAIGNARELGIPGMAENPSPSDHEAQTMAGAVVSYRLLLSEGSLEAKVLGRTGTFYESLVSLGLVGLQDEDVGGADVTVTRRLGPNLFDVEANATAEHIYSPWHGSHTRPDLAASAADDFTIGLFTLTPALRAESLGPFQGTSAKVGTLLGPWHGFDFRGNFGHSFRAPTLGEMYLEQGKISPNPDLQPEDADYADASVGFHDSHFDFTAGAFDTAYTNMIVYELFAPFRLEPKNFTRAQVWGAEVTAGVHLPYVTATAAYTYAVSDNLLYGWVGKEVPYHPPHRFHARVAGAYQRFRASVDVDAQSGEYTEQDNTLSNWVPPRVFLDAGAGVCLLADAGLWVDLDVRNILDVHTSDIYGYPIPGRAALVMVRVDPGSHTRSTP
jgi:vitamin B12 transporter